LAANPWRFRNGRPRGIDPHQVVSPGFRAMGEPGAAARLFFGARARRPMRGPSGSHMEMIAAKKPRRASPKGAGASKSRKSQNWRLEGEGKSAKDPKGGADMIAAINRPVPGFARKVSAAGRGRLRFLPDSKTKEIKDPKERRLASLHCFGPALAYARPAHEPLGAISSASSAYRPYDGSIGAPCQKTAPDATLMAVVRTGPAGGAPGMAGAWKKRFVFDVERTGSTGVNFGR